MHSVYSLRHHRPPLDRAAASCRHLQNQSSSQPLTAYSAASCPHADAVAEGHHRHNESKAAGRQSSHFSTLISSVFPSFSTYGEVSSTELLDPGSTLKEEL